MMPELINGLFALGGALIGVAGTWIITHRFKERRKISLTISPLARLVDVGDVVKSDIKILFKQNPIESLSMGEISIQNSGNVEVQSLEASVIAMKGSSLMDFEITSANFTFDNNSLATSGDDHKRTIKIDFLNVNDKLVIGYKLAGRRELPNVLLRKIGVDVATERELVGWIPDIYAEVVFGAFSEIPGFAILGRFVRPYQLYLRARKERDLTTSSKLKT